MVSYIPKKNRNVIVLSSQRQGAAIEGEEHDFKPEIILDYNKIKSGRARNPVGIQVPILAAIRMFVPVGRSHCETYKISGK